MAKATKRARGRRGPARLTALAVALIALGLAAQFAVERSVRAAQSPQLRHAGDAARGEYVLRMSGCVACHTDADGGAPLAGGRRLETPFGTFVTPNITPGGDADLGNWSLEQLAAALKMGISPSGEHYYPAFPYTSYTSMSDQDIADLKAYLDALAPVDNDVPGHDLAFPFSFRPMLAWWKLLFFDPDRSHGAAAQTTLTETCDESVSRGRYIVNGPGHCAECHTQRNSLGGFSGAPLAGNLSGPDGNKVPPIRGPGALEGWTAEDVVFALESGLLPDGDVLGGSMGEVIEDGTGHLTSTDLQAIADYLLNAPTSGQ